MFNKKWWFLNFQKEFLNFSFCRCKLAVVFYMINEIQPKIKFQNIANAPLMTQTYKRLLKQKWGLQTEVADFWLLYKYKSLTIYLNRPNVYSKDLRGNPKPRVSPDRTGTGPGSGNIFENIFGSLRVGSGIFISGRSGSGYFLPGYEAGFRW